MTQLATFIETLREAADSAAVTEASFRLEASERIKALERERAFAFRRFNLMRSVAEGVERAVDEEAATAAGIDILRSRLDWAGENEAQREILSRFGAVARSIFVSLVSGGEEAQAIAYNALTGFEDWHASRHGGSFWILFEQEVAETPRVDF